MGLNLPEMPNIFPHSKSVDTGGGNVRIGQNDILVALDGTGDFDSLVEAIRSIPGGGSIFLKKGTYKVNYEDVGERFTIPSNTKITGEGEGSIIYLDSTGAADVIINLRGKSNITFEDIKINSNGGGDTNIDVSGISNVTFDNCVFHSRTGGSTAFMYNEFSENITDLKIINCSEGSGSAAENLLTGDGVKIQIINNYLENWDCLGGGGTQNIDNSIIMGNVFEDITLDAGSDNNVCIGNQTDVVITNNGAGNQVANNAVF